MTRGAAAFLASCFAHALAAVAVGIVLKSVTSVAAAPPEALDVDLAAIPDSPALTEQSSSAGDERRSAAPGAFLRMGVATSGQKTRVAPAPNTNPRPRGATDQAVARRPSVDTDANDHPSNHANNQANNQANKNDRGGPARFVLGSVAATTAPTGREGVSTWPLAAHGGEDITGEAEVSVRARLLSAAPLVYPAAARKAEIEIDLPVEIVVDVDGRVTSAHALGRAGYGLDEAALRAIRAYRFSPAIRAGRPVPVRMRWTVQFRLG